MPSTTLQIRPLEPDAADEIDLVAQRMRATLIEVEGEAVGTALYSMDWLRDRVRFHVDPQRAVAQVLLAVQADGEVLGHIIVRRELGPDGVAFGLFSTTYVTPPARRHGVADALLLAGEQWMRDQRLPSAATWTSASNSKLIRLYGRHGYVQAELHPHETTGTPMVRLARRLTDELAPTRRLDQALQLLQAQSRPEQLQALAGFGLTGAARLGLSVPQMRALAKQLGREHALALALWDTAIPDAQIVASLVAEPALLTVAQMNHWTRGMQAWDVCDQACTNAFRHSPLAWARMAVWAGSPQEFVKRAAFALLAVMAVHDKRRSDVDFIAMLPLIEAAADDERNFVKKAVNWALRQIGKRSRVLLPEAIACAERLRARPEKSARWIAADALRELRPLADRLGTLSSK